MNQQKPVKGLGEWTGSRRIIFFTQRYSRGEANLSGASFNSVSLATSDMGPNRTMGRMKPGCLRLTLSYAGNLDVQSENTTSSQWSCKKEFHKKNIINLCQNCKGSQVRNGGRKESYSRKRFGSPMYALAAEEAPSPDSVSLFLLLLGCIILSSGQFFCPLTIRNYTTLSLLIVSSWINTFHTHYLSNLCPLR